ncbi:hypothetical protein SAMN04487955_113107 [Halomonas korlensis]|uniref:Uncharacterized protein n=1 Tax=Halomonas korlensis TaxID=463301 RepID=A0A1I7JZN2_9GAMM|nr:hypothetical protein SAMN04487955_113107 [Halomonas korlensis]
MGNPHFPRMSAGMAMDPLRASSIAKQWSNDYYAYDKPWLEASDCLEANGVIGTTDTKPHQPERRVQRGETEWKRLNANPWISMW